MPNMITTTLIDARKLLADNYGWAISTVEIDTTYGICERPIITISPIADPTLGGAGLEKKKQIDANISCTIWQPPHKRVIALLPMDAQALDYLIEDAAYELGAWDMVRNEMPPNYSALDVYFGRKDKTVILIDDEPNMPDRYGDIANDDVIERARHDGYLAYRFRAASIASDSQRRLWISKDTTLSPDGTRNLVTLRRIPFYGPMPEVPGSGGHQHIFEFGKKNKKKGNSNV